MSDFVKRVLEFNEGAGRPNKWTTRLVANHIGFQMEELCEKLQLGVLNQQLTESQQLHVWGLEQLAKTLHLVGMQFKEGFYDGIVDGSNRDEMLDADIDIAVFTVGSMMVQGADAIGACDEVCRSNESKKFDDGEYHLDANQKIQKGPNFTKPNLKPFVGK